MHANKIIAQQAKAKSGAARKRGAYHLLLRRGVRKHVSKGLGSILDADFEEKLKFPEMSYFVTFTVGT